MKTYLLLLIICTLVFVGKNAESVHHKITRKEIRQMLTQRAQKKIAGKGEGGESTTEPPPMMKLMQCKNKYCDVAKKKEKVPKCRQDYCLSKDEAPEYPIPDEGQCRKPELKCNHKKEHKRRDDYDEKCKDENCDCNQEEYNKRACEKWGKETWFMNLCLMAMNSKINATYLFDCKREAQFSKEKDFPLSGFEKTYLTISLVEEDNCRCKKRFNVSLLECKTDTEISDKNEDAIKKDEKVCKRHKWKEIDKKRKKNIFNGCKHEPEIPTEVEARVIWETLQVNLTTTIQTKILEPEEEEEPEPRQLVKGMNIWVLDNYYFQKNKYKSPSRKIDKRGYIRSHTAGFGSPGIASTLYVGKGKKHEYTSFLTTYKYCKNTTDCQKFINDNSVPRKLKDVMAICDKSSNCQGFSHTFPKDSNKDEESSDYWDGESSGYWDATAACRWGCWTNTKTNGFIKKEGIYKPTDTVFTYFGEKQPDDWCSKTIKKKPPTDIKDARRLGCVEEFCNGELGSPKEVVEKAHKGTNPEKDCTKLGGPGGITAYRQRDKKFGLGHCALTTCAYYAATSNFEYKYPFGSKIGDGDHPLPFRRRRRLLQSHLGHC